MLPRVSQTNPSVVSLAAMHAKMQEAVTMAAAVKCMTQHAHHAAKPAKFPLNPAKTVLYIAATALQTEVNYKKSMILVRSFTERTFLFKKER